MISRGDRIDGFRIERLLGRGGMGAVFEAVQESLGRPVALKVLRPELADDPVFAERLRREGRLQAAIEHPNVLDVYEVGESAEGLYLSMRLVRGGTLLDQLRNGELDANRALHLLEQTARALDAAHAAGLVHRDVKPQNVLVEGERAYLADFGLTRTVADSTIAASRPMLGTVAYAAPEVIHGAEPGAASDRYSFAATVFHCLTGDLVFPRGSEAAVLYAHANEAPPAASERRPELPPELDPILARALAKNPTDRPRRAVDLVTEVRSALESAPGEALGPPAPVDPRRPTPVTAQSPAPVRPVGSDRRRGRALLAAAGIVLAAIGGVAAGTLIDQDEAPEVPVPAPAEGAITLGSGLGEQPDRSVDCLGQVAGTGSPSCSIMQSELPDASLAVPEDGLIVGWTVRGASGEMALDVIRPEGADTIRAGISPWETVGNAGPHRFATRQPVQAGDRVGLHLGPEATIGISEEDGAETVRWIEPEGGGYGRPDRLAASGFDYELALRVEFQPGREQGLPPHVRGAEAARAPPGAVRERDTIQIHPVGGVRLQLVQVRGRVALDLLRGKRRTLRIFVPEARPGGQAIGLAGTTYRGETFGEASVWWVNPDSGRLIYHFYGFTPTHIEYWG